MILGRTLEVTTKGTKTKKEPELKCLEIPHHKSKSHICKTCVCNIQGKPRPHGSGLGPWWQFLAGRANWWVTRFWWWDGDMVESGHGVADWLQMKKLQGVVVIGTKVSWRMRGGCEWQQRHRAAAMVKGSGRREWLRHRAVGRRVQSCVGKGARGGRRQPLRRGG